MNETQKQKRMASQIRRNAYEDAYYKEHKKLASEKGHDASKLGSITSKEGQAIVTEAHRRAEKKMG